jgi:Domain of unknown function (DUF4332)
MTNLKKIPGIGNVTLELLKAAGFPDAESLAKAGVDELARELERANKILQISKRPLPRSNIEKWISTARDLTGTGREVAAEEFQMPINHELSPQVISMLAAAPFAIPLPARLLVGQQLAVGDIPAAILLNRYSGDLDVRIDERVPAPKPVRHSSGTGNVIIADTSATRVEIDNSRIKSTDAFSGAVQRNLTAKSEMDNDRVALIRGPRLETNQGRDPNSRAYIRGVLHSHPVSMSFGAAITLIIMTLLPIGIVSAALLLLSQEMPTHFSWVPKWVLAFPVSLPVFGIAYAIWGLGCGCRICGQKIFIPRMCLKNSKAHHIRGLGYIIPVCLHILLFKWFRCTYCGTPVRLKK